MPRAVLSVIAGYATMFAFVFITFTIAYVMLGAGGALKEGSYQVSTTWLIISSILSLIAAILGGAVCALIARKITPPMVLAAVVFLFGMLMAVLVLTSPTVQPTTRPADVGAMEAMQNANTPAPIALANPFIGAIGVLIGARLVRRPTATSVET